MQRQRLSNDRAHQWRVHRWRLLRLIALAIVVGSAVGILAAAGILGVRPGGEIRPARIVSAAAPVGLPTGPQVGNLAPDFEFSAMDGRRLRLSSLRGRPVMLNFWATWCTPCRREMPDIQRLQRKHAAQGLVVIAMNRGERLEPARTFLNELGLDFSVSGIDLTETVYNAYAPPFKPMPISVFIDRAGIVTAYHLGLATLEQMEEFYAGAVKAPP